MSIAEKIKPNDYWVNIGMAQAYWSKDEYDKSLVYLQKAYELTADPSWETGISIGRLFMDIGDYASAEKYFNESFNIESRCHIIPLLNMTYLAQGKFDMALHFLDSICRISHCTSECYRQRFQVYFSKKDIADAELYYEHDFDKTLIIRSSTQIPFMDQVSKAWIYFETGRKKRQLTGQKSEKWKNGVI